MVDDLAVFNNSVFSVSRKDKFIGHIKLNPA